MKHVSFFRHLGFEKPLAGDRDVSLVKIFSGVGREFFELSIKKGSELKKHRANGPIALICLSGTGEFRFDEDLSESRVISSGDFLTLEANVDHSIIAETEMRLLLTKFIP